MGIAISGKGVAYYWTVDIRYDYNDSMMAATVGRREESMEGKEREVGNKEEKLLVNAEWGQTQRQLIGWYQDQDKEVYEVKEEVW